MPDLPEIVVSSLESLLSCLHCDERSTCGCWDRREDLTVIRNWLSNCARQSGNQQQGCGPEMED
ncbi:MAG: hypothetical protein GXX96_11975 [Planctomycetaceae bacterium]|nr:hypothetical protein [Planctomycetaceae bacterium]